MWVICVDRFASKKLLLPYSGTLIRGLKRRFNSGSLWFVELFDPHVSFSVKKRNANSFCIKFFNPEGTAVGGGHFPPPPPLRFFADNF